MLMELSLHGNKLQGEEFIPSRRSPRENPGHDRGVLDRANISRVLWCQHHGGVEPIAGGVKLGLFMAHDHHGFSPLPSLLSAAMVTATITEPCPSPVL